MTTCIQKKLNNIILPVVLIAKLKELLRKWKCFMDFFQWQYVNSVFCLKLVIIVCHNSQDFLKY